MRELRDKADIDDTFRDEHVLAASQDLIPWFADFANYLASDIVPSDLSFHQRNKFMYDVKKFFWDEPYLYRICANGLIQNVKCLVCWRHAIPHPLVDITAVSEPLIRYYNVVTIGQFFIKMLMNFVKHVTDANEIAALQEGKSSP